MENERKDVWIQLVMVRFEPAHDAYLYRAPHFKCDVGDTVLVNFGGNRYGKVLNVDTICVGAPHNYKAVRNVAKAFGAAWPLPPVLKIVHEEDVEFGDDDWKEEDDDALRTE